MRAALCATTVNGSASSARARADGRLPGSTGVTFDDDGGAMIGYVLARDAWGHGFATEALTAALDVLGIVRVQAGGLDLDYLRTHAPSIEVADLLERALAGGTER